MKYFVTVHNMINDDPDLKYIVVKIDKGESWYYGAWSKKEIAEAVAKDLGNAIVLERA